MILYLIFIIFLALFNELNLVNEYFSIIILFSFSILYLFHFWKKIHKTIPSNDSFGPALILATLGFRIIYLFDTIIYGTRFDIWPETVNISEPIVYYYIKSEFITILGLFVLVRS